MTNAETIKTNHYFLRTMAIVVALAVMASSLVSTTRPAHAAFPCANGKIAFTSTKDGTPGI